MRYFLHPPRVTTSTKAHDIELSIANHGAKKDIIVDRQKNRHDGKTSDKTSIKPIQELMTMNTMSIKISTRDKKKEVKKVGPTQKNERR